MQAVQPRGLARFWSDLGTPISKLKGGAKLAAGVEGSFELDLADKEKLAVPAIQTALQAADKVRKELLVVKAQVLAAPEHRAVAHSLRSGLDTRKASVKVLFAGSSEAVLREMFSRSAAPFYNWAPLEPLPLLRDEFVAAMVRQLATVARKPLRLGRGAQAHAGVLSLVPSTPGPGVPVAGGRAAHGGLNVWGRKRLKPFVLDSGQRGRALPVQYRPLPVPHLLVER